MATSNTTITLVVTTQKLDVRELQRLAIQVHGSMARGIQPYSTTEDGDALFAVTTAEVDNPSLSAMELSTIASETAWDAVLASVPPPDPLDSSRAHAITKRTICGLGSLGRVVR